MTTLAKAASPYEEDFVRWSAEQAETLRDLACAGTNLPLDWENLAEEVEGLGQQLRYELHSRIATILEHLLKLRFSKAPYPRRGWADTIDRSRGEIERIFERSPSLRDEVESMIASERPRAARFVWRTLLRHGEASSSPLARLEEGAQFSSEEILEDWFPEDADSP